MTSLAVANTILQQLGGRRFQMMTGAKHFVGSPDALSFRLPGAGGFTEHGINAVRIRLAGDDTYTVTFSKFRNGKLRQIAEYDQTYADQLRDLFEQVTGLRTVMDREAIDDFEGRMEGNPPKRRRARNRSPKNPGRRPRQGNGRRTRPEAFVYVIDMDERGIFATRVISRAKYDRGEGKEIFSASTEESETGEFWPVEDGFMRHGRDVQGLGEYLRSLGALIPGDSLELVG